MPTGVAGQILMGKSPAGDTVCSILRQGAGFVVVDAAGRILAHPPGGFRDSLDAQAFADGYYCCVINDP